MTSTTSTKTSAMAGSAPSPNHPDGRASAADLHPRHGPACSAKAARWPDRGCWRVVVNEAQLEIVAINASEQLHHRGRQRLGNEPGRGTGLVVAVGDRPVQKCLRSARVAASRLPVVDDGVLVVDDRVAVRGGPSIIRSRLVRRGFRCEASRRGLDTARRATRNCQSYCLVGLAESPLTGLVEEADDIGHAARCLGATGAAVIPFSPNAPGTAGKRWCEAGACPALGILLGQVLGEQKAPPDSRRAVQRNLPRCRAGSRQG